MTPDNTDGKFCFDVRFFEVKLFFEFDVNFSREGVLTLSVLSKLSHTESEFTRTSVVNAELLTH